MPQYDRKGQNTTPATLPTTAPKTENINNLPVRKPLKQLLWDNPPPVIVSQEVKNLLVGDKNIHARQ